jgi:hypothetical protein
MGFGRSRQRLEEKEGRLETTRKKAVIIPPERLLYVHRPTHVTNGLFDFRHKRGVRGTSTKRCERLWRAQLITPEKNQAPRHASPK